jgi:hypothetical protein
MICHRLFALVAGSLLAGCDVNDSLSGVAYARSVSDRAFAQGEGEATVSQIFGAATRTCVGIGDREEALATLDLQTQRALGARGRDQYSVVVVQFDETGRATFRRQFHIRNAFAYVDIDEPRARCLGPTDVVQVRLTRRGRERMAGIRIH